MKYRIETKYAWYNKGSTLILIYYIQNVPFTFDELPEIAKQHPEVIKLADEEKRWEPEDLYRASMYLMMEERPIDARSDCVVSAQELRLTCHLKCGENF